MTTRQKDMEKKRTDAVNNDGDLLGQVNDILRNMELSAIRNFLRQGESHGTTVEALREAFNAVLSGEADTLARALRKGAAEWYK
jgi:hypothetical protein